MAGRRATSLLMLHCNSVLARGKERASPGRLWGSVDVSVTTCAGGRLVALSMQNAGAVIDSEASLVRLPTIRLSIAQTVVAS